MFPPILFSIRVPACDLFVLFCLLSVFFAIRALGGISQARRGGPLALRQFIFDFDFAGPPRLSGIWDVIRLRLVVTCRGTKFSFLIPDGRPLVSSFFIRAVVPLVRGFQKGQEFFCAPKACCFGQSEPRVLLWPGYAGVLSNISDVSEGWAECFS